MKEKKNQNTGAFVSWRKMLGAVPVHNKAAESRETDPDRVEITVTRKKPRYLIPPISWIIHPKLTVTFELDRLGAWIWKQCDGKKTAEKIIDDFAALHDLRFHEARTAVSDYLSLLAKNGAIALVYYS